MFTLVLTILFCGNVYCKLESKPNIIMILMDDGGYGDIGFNGSPDIKSPFIDSLAEDGLILKRHYSNTFCTPSRAELMTGRHAIANGIQSNAFKSFTPECINASRTLLPELIKSNGYATHMIGKWHLGYALWNCFPCTRGFDSFMGYVTSSETYVTHVDGSHYDFMTCGTNSTGDFVWENLEEYRGVHSSIAFMDRAQEIITNHNASQPLFLYFAMQLPHNPHTVNYFTRSHYERALKRGLNKQRAKMQALVYTADDMVKELTEILDAKGMMDDSIIIMVSDNGGDVGTGVVSNLNLRGGKYEFYEGGIRTYGFIYSKKHLAHKGETHSYIHIMDWFPTLISFSGGWDNWNDTEKPVIHELDAVDQSDFLLNGGEAPRTEFLVHIDSVTGSAAYIEQDWKLILGPPEQSRDCIKGATYVLGMAAIDKNTTALFNITGDPTEETDLSDEYRDVVARLTYKISLYTDEETPLQCTIAKCRGKKEYCYPTEEHPYYNAFDCCGQWPAPDRADNSSRWP